MLVELLLSLRGVIPGVGVVRYLSVRIVLAALTTFALTLILIPLIAKMAARRGLADREGKSDSGELEALHAGKRSTPILGGLAILIASFTAIALWGRLQNFYLLLTSGTLLSLGLCGLVDDVVKTFGKDKKNRKAGLSARQKLAWQALTAALAGVLLVGFHDGEFLPKAFAADHQPQFHCRHELPPALPTAPGACGCVEEAPSNLVEGTTVYPPFLKSARIPLGAFFFVAFTVLVVVGSSNAVNLTDGLDGLAAGCSIFVCIVYLVLSYVSGRSDWSAYLGIPYVPGAGELSVVCSALAGAAAGFLWFNCHPAEIFMGDTGSLPLGGAIGLMAIITKHDLLLVLAGGIFVAEALSVILQVLSFKLTGRRLLRCAPLHHHFEFAGWKETKVVQRFWIIAAFLALLSLITLKLR